MRRGVDTARLQRKTVALVVVASGAVMWRGTMDVFTLPKVTLVVVGAIVCAMFGAARSLRDRHLQTPASPYVPAVGFFLLALVVATVTAPDGWRALVGSYTVNSGLVGYVAYATLGLTVVAAYRREHLTQLVGAFVVAGGAVAAYGAVQAVGLDPVNWSSEHGRGVVSTLGNANFAGGYLAIVVPLAAWGAAFSGWSTGARVASGAVTLGCLAVLPSTGARQGVIALAVALAVFAAAWLLTRDGTVRRVGLGVLATGVMVGAGLFVAGAAGTGPLGFLPQDVTFRQRLQFWDTAVAMLADRPLIGIGLDQYGNVFREYRSMQAAVELGTSWRVEDPHNVPLAMFASGGVLLGAAYLAVVGVTAWALVRGARRLDSAGLLLLGALGAAWASYQAQALVSIDVPSLAVAHWVLAGAIVRLGSDPASRTLLGSAPQRRRGHRSRWSASAIAVYGIGGLLVALSVVPLLADAAAKTALRHARDRGDGDAALVAFDRADRLAPWQGRYLERRGKLLSGAGHHRPAFEAFVEAARRDAGSLSARTSAAWSAHQAGLEKETDTWLQRAFELEPQAPGMYVFGATIALDRGDVDAALQQVRYALELDPESVEGLLLLGRIHAAEGDRAAAAAAFERAIEIDPENEEAQRELAGVRPEEP